MFCCLKSTFTLSELGALLLVDQNECLVVSVFIIYHVQLDAGLGGEILSAVGAEVAFFGISVDSRLKLERRRSIS